MGEQREGRRTKGEKNIGRREQREGGEQKGERRTRGEKENKGGERGGGGENLLAQAPVFDPYAPSLCRLLLLASSVL